MNGQWIKISEGDTAVIFVHGVLSDGETCWLHENGTYWPEVLAGEAEIPEIGIYEFTYKTGFFSGTYRLGDVVDALREHMQLDRVSDKRRLVFVCHSMGGIVARKFVVEHAAMLIENRTKIGLFLIASPSLGSRYANWLAPLATLFGHSQADALRFSQSNAWLMDLDREFFNLKESGRLNITGKELIEDTFIVFKRFFRNQVVPPFSGARNFGEPFKVPNSDHSSIAKVDGPDAIQHRLLVEFLRTLEDQPRDAARTNRDAAAADTADREPKSSDLRSGDMTAIAKKNSVAVNAQQGANVKVGKDVQPKD